MISPFRIQTLRTSKLLHISTEKSFDCVIVRCSFFAGSRTKIREFDYGRLCTSDEKTRLRDAEFYFFSDQCWYTSDDRGRFCETDFQSSKIFIGQLHFKTYSFQTTFDTPVHRPRKFIIIQPLSQSVSRGFCVDQQNMMDSSGDCFFTYAIGD